MCDTAKVNTAELLGRELRGRDEQAQSAGRSLGQEACRISLRDQIEGRLYHSRESAKESERLNRLVRMIEKNPDVFEMISMMRDLNLL